MGEGAPASAGAGEGRLRGEVEQRDTPGAPSRRSSDPGGIAARLERDPRVVAGCRAPSFSPKGCHSSALGNAQGTRPHTACVALKWHHTDDRAGNTRNMGGARCAACFDHRTHTRPMRLERAPQLKRATRAALLVTQTSKSAVSPTSQSAAASWAACMRLGSPRLWATPRELGHTRTRALPSGCGLVGGPRAPWVSTTHHIINRSGILDSHPARHDDSVRFNADLSIIRTDPFMTPLPQRCHRVASLIQ